MKSHLLPILALSLLLGACTTRISTSARTDTRPAISAGTKVTKWGELPSYEAAGHRFTKVHFQYFQFDNTTDALQLDLLVNQDGTVRDVAVLERSDNPELNKAAAAAFRNARYSLKLSPDDPAPHVVRFTVGFLMIEGTSSPRSDGDLYGSSLGSLGPQPDYSPPPPPTYSYSTSTP
jgi:TonB family protein